MPSPAEEAAATARAAMEEAQSRLDKLKVKQGPKTAAHQTLMSEVKAKRQEYRIRAGLSGERVGAVKVGPPPT